MGNLINYTHQWFHHLLVLCRTFKMKRFTSYSFSINYITYFFGSKLTWNSMQLNGVKDEFKEFIVNELHVLFLRIFSIRLFSSASLFRFLSWAFLCFWRVIISLSLAQKIFGIFIFIVERYICILVFHFLIHLIMILFTLHGISTWCLPMALYWQ